MNNVVIVLEGLHCQNCSNKIIEKINSEENMSCNLNYLNNHLSVDYDKNSEEDILKKITTIVNNIENGIKVYIFNEENGEHKHSHSENYFSEIKKELIPFSIGMIIYITALITEDIMPLFLLSYVIIGHSVIKTALLNLKNGELFDENFLMMIATIGAFVIGEYSEAVAVMIFYEVGETIQNIAVARSKKSISSLLDLKPEKANKVVGNDVISVKPESLKIGDTILIKVGEKIPVDCVIIDGNGQVDTSTINGENVPLVVGVSDNLFGGYVNLKGIITAKVVNTYENSTVSNIISLIEEASKNKGETEKFITKFAKKYTPIVVCLAAIIAFIVPLFAGNFSYWLYTACVFLVISCPCALVVSVPLTFFYGIGTASKNGLLFKGSAFIEKLANTTAVAFDKTGTLTKGVFEITEVNQIDNEFESILVSMESLTNHPIGTTIVKKFKTPIIDILDFEELSGHGISGKYKNQNIFVGKKELMDINNITTPIVDSIGTVVYVAKENNYIGHVVLSDEIKVNSSKTIELLNKLNIKTVMLTGDNEKSAKKIQDKLNLDSIYTNLMPKDKVDAVVNLKNTETVAFVGDGINDAPVLSTADVGLSMGSQGSDLAVDVSDVVIVNDDPYNIIKAIEISRITINKAKENIIFSIGVKVIVMALALFGFANMGLAIFADVGVTLLAILNAIRGKQFKY
ncbi:MAG: heavy metal translocating P-type ATPase [Lachnospirales bacterium]